MEQEIAHLSSSSGGKVGVGIIHLETGRELFVARLGEKSVRDEVTLRRRVELQRSESAVMVRYHQTVGRHERCAASSERHHRAHRIAGQIGESVRVDLQSHFLQLRRELRNLLRHPHPLVRERGRRERQ